MSEAVRKIIENARLAGLNLRLPGQRRYRPAAASPAPAAASYNMFNPAPPKTSRDYLLPDPYASPVAITPESIDFVLSRGYYEHNTQEALRDFNVMGLQETQLRSGHTYLLLQTLDPHTKPSPLKAWQHLHQGGDRPADLEFMRALAARESRSQRELHLKENPAALFRQVIIVVPPHDKTNGRVPWLSHDSGYNGSFDTLLGMDALISKMGKVKAAGFMGFADAWSVLEPPAPRPFDIMESIRSQCGSSRKSSQPAP